MIRIFLLFILPLSIYASKILSYNVYERTDRADIMITFDVPYDGVIKKSRTDSKIIIKLQDASIESSKLKQISSDYINTLAITPLSDYVQLVASITDGVTLKVSKTSDAYGLRLRFQKKATTNTYKATNKLENVIKQKTDSSLSNLPTKKANDMTQSYYIVIAILIIGIIILFFIKKKVTPKNSLQQTNLNTKDVQNISSSINVPSGEVSIRFQKTIDENNSVVMLDFMEQSYLIMMGSNNVLLDRFNDDKPSSQEEFNIILQDHQQALDGFLNVKDVKDEVNEPSVKSYSQKASTISYNV